MVDRNPIEAGPEVMRHVLHQIAREAAKIFHRTGVFRADDEAEMVPVAVAARPERGAVRCVGLGVEQGRIAPVARDAVAFEIGYMFGERRGAKVHALMPHDARLDDDAAAIRAEARHRHRAPTAPQTLRAATAALAQGVRPAVRRRGEPAPRAAGPCRPNRDRHRALFPAGSENRCRRSSWDGCHMASLCEQRFLRGMYGRLPPEPYAIVT